MKNAQVAKQDDYQKQTHQDHYGPPHQQNRAYGRYDNKKLPNITYDRENYLDKHSRNDGGRSPSRDRSNSQTRSPGDNHRNGASFYDQKKITRKLSRSPRSTHHHRKVSNTRRVTRPRLHSSETARKDKNIKRKR
jgi:hypothetical protein